MNDPWLHETAEWSGYWWLPQDPENSQPGVLRYDPQEGLTLSLIGGFEDKVWEEVGLGVRTFQGDTRQWDVLHGLADDLEVTLLDCLPTSSTSYRTSLTGPAKQQIRASTALVGAHVHGKEAKVFTGCRVSVEGLTEWSAVSALTYKFDLAADRTFDGRARISTEPVSGRAAEHDGTVFRLEHSQRVTPPKYRLGSTLVRMLDTAVLHVEPATLSSLESLRRAVGVARDLISLCTNRAAALLWITLAMPPDEQRTMNGYSAPTRTVALYEKQVVRGEPEADSSRRGPLFTTQDLPFEQVLPRWLEIRDRFAATCDLILGLRYLPGGYLATQFTQAVTAAEAMHRALDPDPPIPKAEFDELKKALRAAVPVERVDWLNSRLLHNDPTLRERLLDLADRMDPEAKAMLLPDPQRWAGMATKARNDLAHTGRSASHDITDLYAVTRVTTAVVLLNLLHEVGLDGKRQRAILVDNSDFSTAARLSRKHCTST